MSEMMSPQEIRDMLIRKSQEEHDRRVCAIIERCSKEAESQGPEFPRQMTIDITDDANSYGIGPIKDAISKLQAKGWNAKHDHGNGPNEGRFVIRFNAKDMFPDVFR